jgi:hypothetical protein
MAAVVGNFRHFDSGAQRGAWLGLVPSQNKRTLNRNASWRNTRSFLIGLWPMHAVDPPSRANAGTRPPSASA